MNGEKCPMNIYNDKQEHRASINCQNWSLANTGQLEHYSQSTNDNILNLLYRIYKWHNKADSVSQDTCLSQSKY